MERRRVDGDAARLQRVFGQIQREAERVVELERDIARKNSALLQAGRAFAEKLQAVIERPFELRLFELQRFGDDGLGTHKLRVGVTHFANERRNEGVHQRLDAADLMCIAHGAPHDTAQHVAATLVRGQHAVGDQKTRRAQMVGDDPARDAKKLRAAIDAGFFRASLGRFLPDRLDEILEEIDVVIVVLALQHGRDAFEAHAGIDRGTAEDQRGRLERAVRIA